MASAEKRSMLCMNMKKAVIGEKNGHVADSDLLDCPHTHKDPYRGRERGSGSKRKRETQRESLLEAILPTSVVLSSLQPCSQELCQYMLLFTHAAN